MATPERVILRVEGEYVLATGPSLHSDRRARLFFSSILGAEPTPEGWRCPRRHHAVSDLIIRINSYLEAKGWRVERVGVVDDEVQRARSEERRVGEESRSRWSPYH